MSSYKIINVITPFYYPEVNGVSFVAQRQVQALLSLGYYVNVITCQGGKSIGNEDVYCFDIKGNGTLIRPIRGDVHGYVNKLVQLSKNSVCNFFHAWHTWSTNVGLANVEHLNTTNYLYSHGTSFTSDSVGIKKYIRNVIYLGEKQRVSKQLNKINGLITITDNTTHHRCYDSITYDGDVKFYLPNPIPHRECDITNGVAEFNDLFNNGLRTAFCISNYQAIKNQEYLLELACKYKFNIVFVGSVKNRYYYDLVKLIHKYGLEKRAKLMINVSNSIISWLFRKSDFFLFASKNDFSPLTLIESNSFSLPFISFKTADCSRKGGYFAENEEEYEKLLINFLSLKKNELEHIGSEGEKYYDHNNSDDAYMANIKDFLSLQLNR